MTTGVTFALREPENGSGGGRPALGTLVWCKDRGYEH